MTRILIGRSHRHILTARRRAELAHRLSTSAVALDRAPGVGVSDPKHTIE